MITGGDELLDNHRNLGLFFNFAQTYFPSGRLSCYAFLVTATYDRTAFGFFNPLGGIAVTFPPVQAAQ